ncbi:hypothetical protein N7471_007823 [Penicillium samsonianum]|uniref:uncharacterized protein n=1 Tax=Penicillium samsonianum TaxID=1882272 RepID=UPI0025491242|nr:uncharacterized protein N7471_007823 [Penicillium samsonianum]KAJ6132608.1 hypothetical protein N7471_007823 [Penicillium samsonianum]
MSDGSNSPDVECFEALPEKQYQIIQLKPSGRQRVVQYIRFTNVPPDIIERFSSKSARLMFNNNTRSMIIKLVGKPHEIASYTLGLEIHDGLRDIGLNKSITVVGSARVKGEDPPRLHLLRLLSKETNSLITKENG